MNIAQLYSRFQSKLILLSLFFLLPFFLGMSLVSKSAPAASSEEQVRIKTDQVLVNLKSAYELESLPDFTGILDRDFENQLTFQSNLENYFISHKNSELIIITDAVLINKDKVSVRLHWFKKFFTNSGVFNKSQGSSQFVFKQYPEGLKLIYIRQDNPFF